ncbi:hypothetical protein JB92DRAFT_3098975 [Gautieria morchelliformis]|nr:hypothetical protein JB92DRAFT_3098975 [Gautieria morchelliformis]
MQRGLPNFPGFLLWRRGFPYPHRHMHAIQVFFLRQSRTGRPFGMAYVPSGQPALDEIISVLREPGSAFDRHMSNIDIWGRALEQISSLTTRSQCGLTQTTRFLYGPKPSSITAMNAVVANGSAFRCAPNICTSRRHHPSALPVSDRRRRPTNHCLLVDFDHHYVTRILPPHTGAVRVNEHLWYRLFLGMPLTGFLKLSFWFGRYPQDPDANAEIELRP